MTDPSDYLRHDLHAACDRRIAVLEAENERLRRWKAEATEVIAEWEKVHEALGRPGRLGQSKAAASEAEVLSLQAKLHAAWTGAATGRGGPQ